MDEARSKWMSVHGHVRYGVPTPTYSSWTHMIGRCTNVKNEKYSRYGGRGIKVCSKWLKFENFLADMGERPPNMTLERMDNDKGYCPSNCRWATNSEQQFNRGIQSNNTSGVKGVYFDKARNNWYARIGSNIHLGRFDTKEEAISARKRAEIRYGV